MNSASRASRSNRPSRGRSAAASPSGSSDDVELLVSRRRPDERRNALGEERRTDPLVLDDARPVEKLLDAHARLIRCGDGDGRRSLDHRETDLTWERAQSQAERAAVDCGARSGGSDRHAGAVEREISVGGGDAETSVETVRELSRPHRPEPVVERDAPLAAETEMADGTFQEPDGECLVQRLVRERLRPRAVPEVNATPLGPTRRIGRSRFRPSAAAASSLVEPESGIPSMVVRGGTASRSTTHSPPSASAGIASTTRTTPVAMRNRRRRGWRRETDETNGSGTGRVYGSRYAFSRNTLSRAA